MSSIKKPYTRKPKKPVDPLAPPTESIEQIRLFQYAHYHWWRAFLFAIGNGGKRAWTTAKRLKREGVTAGVPDCFLSFPANGYHGLYIEMKRKNGVRSDLSDSQKQFIRKARSAGYAAEVAFGWEHAVQITEKYLEGVKPPEKLNAQEAWVYVPMVLES